jgi:RHS repeat-associated protein
MALDFSYYGCNNTTDSSCHQLQTITNALGQITTFSDYVAGGLAAKVVDANGLVADYQYDGLQRVTNITQYHQSTPSDLQETVLTYRGAKEHVATITFAEGTAYTFIYDDAEQLKQVIDSLGNRLGFEYDKNGNREITDQYDPSNTLEQRVEAAYDLIDNIEQITAGSSIWGLKLNAKGSLTNFTDPKQNPENTNQYDLLERLTHHVDSLGNTTQFFYNVADQTKKVIAPNGVTTEYSYDDLSNVLSETSPDRGLLNYRYDKAGNTVYREDARNIAFDFKYDELNRLTDMLDQAEGQHNIIYIYDTCQNGIGRLCKINESSNLSEFSYDAWGNVESVTRTYSAFENMQTYTTQYDYDNENRITQVVYPSGRDVDYVYDVMGRVTQVTSNGSLLLSGRQHRADNQMTHQTYGNGAQEVRYFDDQARLDSVTLNSTEILGLGYDANGNVTSIDATANQVPEYGPLDRLIGETGFGSVLEYGYDDNGNRKSLTTASNVLPYTYLADSNQLSQIDAQPVQRDASGNALNLGSRTFRYNAHGQLATFVNQGQAFNYAYDARWQRLRKRHGSWLSDYHYDLQGRLIGISDGAGQMQMEYIYADATAVNPFAKIENISSTGQATNVRTVELGFSQLPTASNDVNFQCESPDSTNGTSGLVFPGVDDTPSFSLTEAEKVDQRAKFIKFAPILYMMLLINDELTYLGNIINLERDLLPLLDAEEGSIVWRAIEGATHYAVSVSADPSTLGQSTDANTTCANEALANIYELTPNQTSYVRVWANVDGQWQYQDYVINADQGAQANQTETLYIIQDQLGTPRQAIDESQTIVWQWTSDGFGVAYPNEDVDTNGHIIQINLRFAGQYYDKESQLHYNWHRYYAPELGRYLSSDTLGLFDGPNTFAYVQSNPSSGTDPTGEFGLVGAGIGGGIDLAGQLIGNGGRWSCVNWGSVAGSAALGAITGGVGGVIGKKALSSGLKGLSRSNKGVIGEGLSRIKYFFDPRFIRLGGNTRRIPGHRAYPDHVYRRLRGSKVYVESKFGTSGLTAPQRIAQKSLGPNHYRVDRWTYPRLGEIGSLSGEIVGGAAAGAANGSRNRRSSNCNCN